MVESPFTEDLKELIVEQLIDAEQARAGLEEDDDAAHFAGHYQHGEKEATRQVVGGGVEALMGLVSVQPPEVAVSKDDQEPPHYAGHYQHVDDGIFGDLRYTSQGDSRTQASVAAHPGE